MEGFVILILYPPGWVSLYPAHPLGIATLASCLHAEGVECRQIDLEILIHEANRSRETGRFPIAEMLDSTRFSRALRLAGSPARLHEFYTVELESLARLIDLDEADAVVFSIIGERQFISASILASYWRSRGVPVFAGGCYVRRNAAPMASMGIYDRLFTGYDSGSFASACGNALDASAHARRMTETVIDRENCAMDFLPRPDFDENLAACYRRAVRAMYKTRSEHLILQYLLDLGCTQRCSFCTRFHHRYESKPVQRTIAEISDLIRRNDTRLVSMTTNGVNFSEERALELYRALADLGAGLEWHAYAVPDLTHPDLIRALADSGCRILRFGLESASTKMLRLLNKQFSPEQAARCFELAHKAGIWVQVSFIAGCPREEACDVEENCRFIEKYHDCIDSIRINPFFLQQDSEILAHPERYGIRPRSWSGSNRGFDEISGLRWEDKVPATIDGIHRMVASMQKHGIGFWGLSCHLLLCALHENGSREETKRWLARVHPYTCEDLPPELILWRIYHAHEPDKCPYGRSWESNYGLIYESGLPGVRS
jgi:pyruvate-formate lyase-activating enzyme